MLNNANKALGYTEVYYNYNSKLFFTDNLGSQFLELDIKTGENDNGNDGTALQPGDNVSELTNDAGYLVSGDNISVLTNDAGYLVSGDNISELTNDVDFLVSGDNISELTNDASYLASGANISELTNDAGYLTSYTETSDLQAVTNRGSTTTNDITVGRLNANHVGVPVVSSLPTTDMLLGDICALNTNNTPYFYDGTDWRALYLVGVPGQPDEPDSDWDKVILRCTYNTDFTDVKNNVDGFSSGSTIVGSPSKFGGGALRIQGSDFCSYGFNAEQGVDRDWMNSGFTIEAWLYIDSLADGDTTLFQKNGLEFIIRRPDSMNEYFMLKLPGEDAVSIQNNPEWYPQQWMHIVYSRNSENGLLTLLLDGRKYNSIDDMNNFTDNEDVFMIGGGPNNSDYFIDDLRVSNFERYTDDYSVPTEQLPTSG